MGKSNPMLIRIFAIVEWFSYAISSTIIGIILFGEATSLDNLGNFITNTGLPSALLFFVVGITAYLGKKVIDLLSPKIIDWLDAQILLAKTLNEKAQLQTSIDETTTKRLDLIENQTGRILEKLESIHHHGPNPK